VIDTVGQRILEVFIPIPKDVEKRRTVTSVARAAVQTRSDLRVRVRLLGHEIEGLRRPDEATINAPPQHRG
jgi:hypothetical protein